MMLGIDAQESAPLTFVGVKSSLVGLLVIALFITDGVGVIACRRWHEANAKGAAVWGVAKAGYGSLGSAGGAAKLAFDADVGEGIRCVRIGDVQGDFDELVRFHRGRGLAESDIGWSGFGEE
jgi:hypothetical protein